MSILIGNRASEVRLPILRRIKRFADLPAGWSYSGEGVPFDRDALNDAEEIASEAESMGFQRMDAIPGVAGEILIAVYSGIANAEVILEPDRSVSYFLERDDLVIEETTDLSIEEAIKKLRTLRQIECLSESWIRTTTSQNYSGSTGWRLGTRAEEYQYSTTSVL